MGPYHPFRLSSVPSPSHRSLLSLFLFLIFVLFCSLLPLFLFFFFLLTFVPPFSLSPSPLLPSSFSRHTLSLSHLLFSSVLHFYHRQLHIPSSLITHRRNIPSHSHIHTQHNQTYNHIYTYHTHTPPPPLLPPALFSLNSFLCFFPLLPFLPTSLLPYFPHQPDPSIPWNAVRFPTLSSRSLLLHPS